MHDNWTDVLSCFIEFLFVSNIQTFAVSASWICGKIYIANVNLVMFCIGAAFQWVAFWWIFPESGMWFSLEISPLLAAGTTWRETWSWNLISVEQTEIKISCYGGWRFYLNICIIVVSFCLEALKCY